MTDVESALNLSPRAHIGKGDYAIDAATYGAYSPSKTAELFARAAAHYTAATAKLLLAQAEKPPVEYEIAINPPNDTPEEVQDGPH